MKPPRDPSQSPRVPQPQGSNHPIGTPPSHGLPDNIRAKVAYPWLPKGLQAALGSIVLRICAERPSSCAKTRCHLRALCHCADEDRQAAQLLENRVWMVVAICGAAVLIGWLLLGLVPMVDSVPKP